MTRLEIGLGVDARLVTTPGGSALALSPDGRTLAFAATPVGGTASVLYVRPLDQLQATALPGTEGAYGPFFSPDGEWVAFFADRKLKKIETRGGTPISISDAPAGRGGDWTSDGRIVFLPNVGGGARLHSVSAAGGTPEPLIDADLGSQRWAQVLPGGRAVLYTQVGAGAGTGSALIKVQPLPSGERKTLVTGTYARFHPAGYLVYVDEGALFAAPFDEESLSMTGPGVRVLETIETGALFGAQVALSDDGTLLVLPGEATTPGWTIDWLDAAGEVRPLRTVRENWRWAKFSPDGRSLAYAVTAALNAVDIWVHDIDRDTTVRLTDGGQNLSPEWTPDGRRITFSATRPGDATDNLYWQPVDGSGGAERLASSPFGQGQPAWHPSGDFLAFRHQKPPDNTIEILRFEREGGARKPGTPYVFVDEPGNEGAPAFSPDGKWLAYTWASGERSEVHVRPFPGPGGRVVVATDAASPVWSPVESTLLFTTLDDPSPIMAVRYAIEDGAFRPERPVVWSPRQISLKSRSGNVLRQGHFALHPDGTRVATAVAFEADVPATPRESHRPVLVLNFLEELRRLSAAAR